MLKNWIPWKLIIKRAAKAYGVIDPISFLARLRRFSQPSEVQEPIELLRAGIIFHARGLINTKAIQNNLDWVWPFWVEKQFNPRDISFIPRAFSFSHVNLTQRNWTAVGQPDLDHYPIVDPKGLITPFYDGWSLDFWILDQEKEHFFPSKNGEVKQELDYAFNLMVKTKGRFCQFRLETQVCLEKDQDIPTLKIKAFALSGHSGQLVVSVRPYNPEGIQFVEQIAYNRSKKALDINKQGLKAYFSRHPDQIAFSEYYQGDVLHQLDQPGRQESVTCKVGMASAALIYDLKPNQEQDLEISLPMEKKSSKLKGTGRRDLTWPEALAGCPKLEIPDQRLKRLFEINLRTLILLSTKEIVPGPYTYKRFWFRDACLMLNPLLAMGFFERSQRIIESFFERQKFSGYFLSQEGEWDSNGQVLWIVDRYLNTTGKVLPDSWQQPLFKAVQWIRKKTMTNKPGTLHSGLFPPGFSAEHLGPNDYYYWDNFWGLAGLFAGAKMFKDAGRDPEICEQIHQAALDLEDSIFTSISKIPEKRSKGGIPASPYRRLDAGAIGSMVADYPLQLVQPKDPKMENTLEYLLKNCLKDWGFFQDMIHSGINAYLTLDLAQTLLRNEDPRFKTLIQATADLASPTGNWPEAVHPFSGGGCMGDGQHGWAAAEWVMIMKSLFFREEGKELIVGSGIFSEWLEQGDKISFGPVNTPLSEFSLNIFEEQGKKKLRLSSSRVPSEAKVKVRIPGYKEIQPEELNTTLCLQKV